MPVTLDPPILGILGPAQLSKLCPSQLSGLGDGLRENAKKGGRRDLPDPRFASHGRDPNAAGIEESARCAGDAGPRRYQNDDALRSRPGRRCGRSDDGTCHRRSRTAFRAREPEKIPSNTRSGRISYQNERRNRLTPKTFPRCMSRVRFPPPAPGFSNRSGHLAWHQPKDRGNRTGKFGSKTDSSRRKVSSPTGSFSNDVRVC